MRSGATPAEAVSSGASTGRARPMKVDTVCAAMAAASADSQRGNAIAGTVGGTGGGVNGRR